MTPFRITGAADTARLAKEPYASFMRHADVFDALCEAAHRHAPRRALSFVVSADPAVPARMWPS